VAVVALVRRKDRMLEQSGYLRLQAEDILILEADPVALQKVIDEGQLDSLGAAKMTVESLGSDRVMLAEAVITPGSRLEGRTAQSMRLHTRFGVNLLGMARQGEPITERLGRIRLAVGDVLLLQGEREPMPEALSALGCLPLAGRDISLGKRKVRWTGPILFGVAILLVVAGILPPQIAFAGAAAGLVLSRAINPRDLYDAIEWPVIVLLGALIPVGAALETTGATQIVALPILALQHEVPIWVLLALVMVITMLLSDIMNNAATAVIMAPLGIAVAKGLGVSVDPFLMAVAVGASSTYLTPIGHQSNLLVMGPGGYQFSDYWRMGLPLDILIVAVAVPLILVVWPL